MTIFSLGSACDLEHFDGNNKISNEGFDVNYSAPVVPLPTDPPNQNFGNSNYNWKSNSYATQDMTTIPNTQTFHPMVGQDSQSWGTVGFGQDYWGPNNDHWTSDNKLLNYNTTNNMVADNNTMVMPGMRPQGAQMPTSRVQFMKNEDMNGRAKNMQVKKVPVVQEEVLPEYPQEKIEGEQKSTWTYLIFLLLILIGTILYRSKYF